MPRRTPVDRRHASEVARRARRASGYAHPDIFPDRGEVWADEDPAPGIPGSKLALDAVGSAELAPASVGDAHINGRLSPNKLNVAGLSDNPNNADGKAVDQKSFGDFKEGLPNFSNFASADRVSNLANDIANKTTSNDVNNILHHKLKKSAFQ